MVCVCVLGWDARGKLSLRTDCEPRGERGSGAEPGGGASAAWEGGGEDNPSADLSEKDARDLAAGRVCGAAGFPIRLLSLLRKPNAPGAAGAAAAGGG